MSRPVSPTHSRGRGDAARGVPSDAPARRAADRRSMLPVVVLSLMLAATCAAAQYTSAQLRQKLQATFDRQVEGTLERLDGRMGLAVDQLRGFVGLFAASKSVERGEFAAYFSHSRVWTQSPGLVAVEYAQRVTSTERTALIEHVRTDRSVTPDGYPNFTIHPLSDQAESCVVTYIEPMMSNEPLHGLDLGADPITRAALDYGRDTAEPAATEPVDLVQLPQHHAGLLFLLPVYRNGALQDSAEHRRDALIGVLVGAFRSQELFTRVLVDQMDPLIDVEVFDGEVLTEDHLLFDRDTTLRIYESNRRTPFHTIQAMPIGGRIWTLSFTALPGFGVDPLRAQLPAAVLIIGGLLSGLLFGVLSSLAGSERRAMKLAERMTHDLRESEQNYSALVHGAPDPIMTLDVLGMLQSLNPTAEEVFGFRAEELVGRHFAKTGILMGSSLARVMKEFTLVIGGAHRPPFELEFVHKDGRHVMLEANPCLIRHSGRLVGVQVIFRDITERKWLESDMQRKASEAMVSNEELGRREKAMRSLLEDLQGTKGHFEVQEKSLRVANKRLEEMGALKDEFVAKASHELRTPLTSIKEGLSLLLDNALGETTEDQRDFLKTMDGDVDRLTELINNMLDISKIEAGRMRLQCQRLDVRQLIEGVLRSYQHMVSQRRILVECGETPPIFADQHRMIQVLSNLLSNAVKFTAEDGTIIVQARRQGTSQIALSVKDNGPGITPQDLPKLFQKFSQVGVPVAGRPRGTGLGLVVCKELVELHKGRIDVTSIVGEGTTFTAVLPAYSDTLALSEVFDELLEVAQMSEGKLVAVVAIDAVSGGTTNGAPHTALERVAGEVRQRLHRGDTVLPIEPRWVVVLAATTPDGPAAIVKRLRTALPVDRLQFGAAVHPADGADAQALFQHATQRAGQDLPMSSPPPSANTPHARVDGVAT